MLDKEFIEDMQWVCGGLSSSKMLNSSSLELVHFRLPCCYIRSRFRYHYYYCCCWFWCCCCCTERLQGISKWNKPYLSKTYKFHSVSLGWLKWAEQTYSCYGIQSNGTYIYIGLKIPCWLLCTFLFVNKF